MYPYRDLCVLRVARWNCQLSLQFNRMFCFSFAFAVVAAIIVSSGSSPCPSSFPFLYLPLRRINCFCFNYCSTEDTQHKSQAQFPDSLCLPPCLPVSLSPCLPVCLSPGLLLIVQLYINTAQRNALPPSFFPFAYVSLLCSALLHLDK